MNSETLINLGLAIITGTIAWFVKQSIALLLAQVSRITDRLHSLEANMPLDYVRREDWLREVAANENRVDNLQKRISDGK